MLADFLIDLMKRVSTSRSNALPMSRTDIGDYLGLSSKTVSRTFIALRRDRWIAARGRYVTVLRSTLPPALERRSELGVQLRQHREADVVGNFVRSLFTTRRGLPPAVRPLSRDGDTSLASLTLDLLRITRLVSSLHPSGHEGGGSLDAFAIQDRN